MPLRLGGTSVGVTVEVGVEVDVAVAVVVAVAVIVAVAVDVGVAVEVGVGTGKMENGPGAHAATARIMENNAIETLRCINQ
jgi:hypothetical protein